MKDDRKMIDCDLKMVKSQLAIEHFLKLFRCTLQNYPFLSCKILRNQ